MINGCYDEGTIQAFLDGELDIDLLEAVARHTVQCEDCAVLLRQAEDESSYAFAALADEFNTLVPTERIRTNLYQAISEIEKPRKSVWSRIFGQGFSFSNPSLVAFASLLLVFGVFTTLFIHRATQNSSSSSDLAKVEQLPNSAASRNVVPVDISPSVTSNEDSVDTEIQAVNPTEIKSPVFKQAVNRPVIEKAAYKVVRSEIDNRRPIVNSSPDTKRPTLNENLPGEESYVKTIATLTDSVNSRKESVLRPSERVAFEKDLAMVNDAISKMQKEVRKNPKNEAAKQVLRTSYQNKIELLNSVADRTELMATLR